MSLSEAVCKIDQAEQCLKCSRCTYMRPPKIRVWCWCSQWLGNDDFLLVVLWTHVELWDNTELSHLSIARTTNTLRIFRALWLPIIYARSLTSLYIYKHLHTQTHHRGTHIYIFRCLGQNEPRSAHSIVAVWSIFTTRLAWWIIAVWCVTTTRLWCTESVRVCILWMLYIIRLNCRHRACGHNSYSINLLPIETHHVRAAGERHSLKALSAFS